MRIAALVKRIIRQFVHDKRTLALLIIAPVFVLSLLYLVLNGDEYTPEIAVVNAPDPMVEKLESETDAQILEISETKAMNKLKNAEIDAMVAIENMEPQLVLEGSNPTANRAVMQALAQALKGKGSTLNQLDPQYVHGSSDLGTFDFFGPVFIGFFAFFFVFLIAGVSFLRERTSATLERLLASPVRRWEIVLGYVLGFGFFTAIQTIIIVSYAIYILELPLAGSFWLVLLTTLLTAFAALTLGTLLSAFANNELQMIQFIPLVIVPQFFFSGIFSLETISDWVSWIGPLTPLYYTVDALRDVMIRGYAIEDIYIDLCMLFGFGFVFMLMNIVALRKHRKL